MLFSRATAVCCILTTLLWGMPSKAIQPPLAGPPTAAKQVDRGVQFYLDGRYEQAIKLLDQAIKQKDLDRGRRLGALQYMAFCHVALGNLDAARDTFRTLLQEQPDFQLPAGTSPKIVDAFESARSGSQHPLPLEPPLIEHQPPDKGTLGASLEIEARVDRLPPAGELVVRYRYDEVSPFSSLRMTTRPDGRFTATLPSPLDTKAAVIFYYLEARDGEGVKQAAAGDQNAPYRVAFGSPPPPNVEEESSSVASKWWIWVIVGGVLAGAGVAVYFSFAGGGDNTGRAIVNIHVTP